MTTKVDRIVAFTLARDLARYCTDEDDRFGPWCYDCSGWTFRAYEHVGVTVPKSSAEVARWGRDTGKGLPVHLARPGDAVIHDRYGDPFSSFGPRGHIGIIVAVNRDGSFTSSESAASRGGVGIYTRPRSFWCYAVRPAFDLNLPIDQPASQEDDLMGQAANDVADIHHAIFGEGVPKPNIILDVRAQNEQIIDLLKRIATKLGA